ncbi:hypothetical protein GCM10009621_19560 [Corynebacterium felinum]
MSTRVFMRWHFPAKVRLCAVCDYLRKREGGAFVVELCLRFGGDECHFLLTRLKLGAVKGDSLLE